MTGPSEDSYVDKGQDYSNGEQRIQGIIRLINIFHIIQEEILWKTSWPCFSKKTIQ